ncbi:UvrD-helicase domain-containing protein [Paenibacillus popilliae]|uniref:DNA helicase n=1 Tax=Paenibacillus popilliae TaxID=78057 RepID=A0ABY3AHB4_PAEPP|nr:UvrD-helicase domain-containing protein [Paenibacillus sp. SDF0028]TQR40175.1 hypothetical protein C7Y44_28230 [Paenibacillus sp. SDF0028]
MRIVVAGAGAGKTTSLAEHVINRLDEIKDKKIIYVITYTNSARDRIKESIINSLGRIPWQLRIETSHAFLLREIIFPFHHLLYDKHFSKASDIPLHMNPQFRAIKIREMENRGIIHVERVTEVAKQVLCGKSKDTKLIKQRRNKIASVITKYLDSVFIDEAQDMDEPFVKVIQFLENQSVNITLMGDPKQDLRGRNAFKGLILTCPSKVEYKNLNYRSPVSHVRLSNAYIPTEEHQKSYTAEDGIINYIFESEVDVNTFVDPKYWDQIFIFKKNYRYTTYVKDSGQGGNILLYELDILVEKSGVKKSIIKKTVFEMKEYLTTNLAELNNLAIFKYIEQKLAIKLNRQDMGKLTSCISRNRNEIPPNSILVSSIDRVKGLEGDKCLFIVTTDIAAYLLKENVEQNKMLNYLYVALTRSRNLLTLLISLEVESKYGKAHLEDFFGEIQVGKYDLTTRD